MRQIFSLGWLVSFTGIVTFKNGRNAREAVAAAPLGQFMLETDCPFLAPAPFRGKRCEPAYVREISLLAAEVKNCSLEELGPRRPLPPLTVFSRKWTEVERAQNRRARRNNVDPAGLDCKIER